MTRLNFITLTVLFVCTLVSAQHVKIKKCSDCGYIEKRAYANYCVRCGEKLMNIAPHMQRMCVICEQTLQKKEIFCPRCGERGQMIKRKSFLKERSPSETIVSSEEAKKSIPIVPFSKKLMTKIITSPNSDESMNHTVECMLFRCQASFAEVKDFYRTHYPSTSILQLHEYMGVFRILRLKFNITKIKADVEVNLYGMPIGFDSQKWKDKEKEIRTQLEQSQHLIKNLKDKEDFLLQSYERKEIAKEKLQEGIRALQVRREIITNSKSYWDTLALQQLLNTEKNILLIVMRKSNNGNILGGLTKGKTAIENLEKIPINTLAKDLNFLIYPGATMVTHSKIRKDLRGRKSQNCTYHTLFKCPGTSEEVEAYYRAYRPKSVLKVTAFDAFRILKLKLYIPQLHSHMEIAFYAATIGPASTKWESKVLLIKKRLTEHHEPLETLQYEIAKIKELVNRGELSKEVLLSREYELERRRSVMHNSPSYWDLQAMDKALASGQNILIITQVQTN